MREFWFRHPRLCMMFVRILMFIGVPIACVLTWSSDLWREWMNFWRNFHPARDFRSEWSAASKEVENVRTILYTKRTS